MIARLTAALLILACASPVLAQRQRAPEPTQSFSEKVAEMQKFEGFINFYWDAEEEKIFLEIDKWGTEFLYVTSTPSSVSGRNRGALGRTRVVKFSRAGSKVFLIQPNYSYRADSDDPLEQRAVAEAYTEATIAGFKVAAEENGRVLVDATDFFMRDAAGGGSGGVDRARSAFYWERTRNFPKNTEIEVTLTLTGGGATAGRGAATAGRGRGAAGRGRGGGGRGGSGGSTVRQHHSLVELPDANYKPRPYDPRAGISSMSYLDYASPLSDPIRKRFASRHRIQKKDPTAAMSEPVEPIVYYVDPGAPEPIRSALVEGASWWNEAFEAIGFKNGFQVKVLPGDADPMDLRYNMILWVHRPSRGWSSGSSVRDPRTGEIIAGRVFLGSQRVRQDFLIGSGLLALYGDGDDTAEKTKIIEEMVLARTRQLSAHEVGHTLGFSHNFAASVRGRTSVMDYPHPYIKIRDDNTFDFSDAYDVGIGEWDKVGIAYGYSDFAPGTDEKKALEDILDNAHQRGLFYLGDVGAGSASPVTHQWDNGSDALTEFKRVMRIRDIALNNLSEANIRVGDPLDRLGEVLVPVYLFHRYQTEAVIKSIGGVDYRFAVRGDGQTIAQVVPTSVQRQALDAALSTISPEALAIPGRLLGLLPPRAPGSGGERFARNTGSTFDPLSAAETAANHTLGLLLNPSRAARLVTNHATTGETPSLNEVLDKLMERTFKSTMPRSPYLAEISRTVNNVALYHVMALAANENAAPQVRAVASMELDELKDWLERQKRQTGDDAQRAHFHFAAAQITQYQADPSQFKIAQPAAVPPGAPIGMGEVLLPGVICDW